MPENRPENQPENGQNEARKTQPTPRGMVLSVLCSKPGHPFSISDIIREILTGKNTQVYRETVAAALEEILAAHSHFRKAVIRCGQKNIPINHYSYNPEQCN